MAHKSILKNNLHLFKRNSVLQAYLHFPIPSAQILRPYWSIRLFIIKMSEFTISRRKFIRNSGLAIAGSSLGLDQFNLFHSDNYPLIDIHQHVHYVGRTDEQLLAHQSTMGAKKTVLLPAGSVANTPATHFGKSNGLKADAWGNSACYEFTQKHKDYFFGANEVPDLPNATKEIEKYLKMGAVVIGELKFGLDCDAPEMQAIYELAAAYDVPVLMHWQYKTFFYGYDRFYKMLEKYPKTNFIGHSMTVWANISGNYKDWSNLYPKGEVEPGGLTVEYLKKYPNFYGDLSAGSGLFALERDKDFAKEFLHKFQNKLLFGSDCPDHFGTGKTCYGSRTIALIRDLIDSKKVKKKLFYGNAKKLLKLPV